MDQNAFHATVNGSDKPTAKSRVKPSDQGGATVLSDELAVGASIATYPREQSPYHGGSTRWWPPSGDHVVLFKANPLRFEYFDRFMGSWEDVKVLDVGCGGGYACEFLARRGAVVFGTDIMAEAIQQARDHAAQENLEIEYHPCTPERLPFNDQTMDAVTCVDVLEHIPNKAQTLCEIYRVLKPGGWFFFDTFNKTFWSKVFIIWLGEILIRFIPRRTHYWPYFIRPDDLKLLLEKSGFAGVEFGGIKSARKARGKSGFPVTVSSKGSTAIIYFAAAQKPIC
ncbi:MAG: 3-demethylubiquinone-9 3-O-methyltransferase [Desulfobacteraceae bacterium]|nr:MAG: 3-demethylubiquinone-9 3-O-methyltransferase [Desulfobacteraceae bacterium]